MVWRREDPQGNEAAKVRWEIVPYTRGRGLDIGCGPYKAFPHFIGCDNLTDTKLFGTMMQPDVVLQDAAKLDMFASQSMDFVFSSHTLEHLDDDRKALREWWRVIKPGGHLVLYLPHADYYPQVGQPGANPDHKRDYRPADVIERMREIGGWDLVECQQRNEDREYSMLLVFRRAMSGKQCAESWQLPKPAKSAAVVRYGGFGDLMQASSVFAGLKEQGYHVTLYATPPASDVVANDPHVDRVILQDKDQVPNANLIDFWQWERKKYDHWVNLSESVEGVWLALPGRTSYHWPNHARQRHLNYNYLQHQHELAGVPHAPRIRFYATDQEKAAAKKRRKQMNASFVALWVLAGSSVHKTWNGADNDFDRVIASLMLADPGIHVILAGSEVCQILEAAWEKEPRVHKTSGKWSIRETLAMLDEVDCVIGPETGVLNAASCLPIPKVVFLSHSSHENLTRDWVNVHPFAPDSAVADCYPCHMLHYGWDTCRKHESGTALCQTTIMGADVWTRALDPILKQHFEKAA